MTAWEHGFEGTALDVAQGRSPNAEVIFATNIEFENIINGLDLAYSLFFFHPGFFLFLQFLFFLIDSINLIFDFA